jgi:hypothetical protein
MRTPGAATQAAMQNPNCKVRRFIRIRRRNYTTSVLDWVNFWTGLDNITAEVCGASDGEVAEYSFTGAGSIIAISEISYVCEQTLTDRSFSITANALNSTLENVVRGYDLAGQPVEVYEGWFNLTTNMLVEPASSIRQGYVDKAPIITPQVGGFGSVEITCRDHASEMSRTNTLKRTHASEILRNPNDTFYIDTGDVGNWKIPWGSDWTNG